MSDPIYYTEGKPQVDSETQGLLQNSGNIQGDAPQFQHPQIQPIQSGFVPNNDDQPDINGISVSNYKMGKYYRWLMTIISGGMTLVTYSVATKFFGDISERENVPKIRPTGKVNLIAMSLIFFILFVFGHLYLATIICYCMIGQTKKALMVCVHFLFLVIGLFYVISGLILFIIVTFGIGTVLYAAFIFVAQITSILFLMGVVFDIYVLAEKLNRGEEISQFEYGSAECMIAATFGQMNLKYACCQAPGLTPTFVAPKMSNLPTTFQQQPQQQQPTFQPDYTMDQQPPLPNYHQQQ
jgi:hypothetical protein